ncbi:class I SAM-dependent methyltransferase [Variovorax sp. UC122_21]|uniref:class I SAM-dependent methyltransferase n=1 Tax=Variovorax sp. UC122_21 TaxID=3374554 RepID=UPI00375691BE
MPSDAAPPASGLSAVPSTLRIPLAARAFGDAMFPRMAVGDASAARLLATLEDQAPPLPRDRATVYGVLARTRYFRALARDFLQANPGGHVVNLGCGLSHYFQWLDDGKARMTDADLPEVLAVRRALLADDEPRHEVRPLDLTAPDWWDGLGLPARDGPPVFLFSEGVLMYLEPAQVEAVLATGRAHRHPSVRPTGAQFRWGLRRPAELARAHPRLRLAGTHEVMAGYGFPHGMLSSAIGAFLGVPMYAVYALHAVD